jgi:hypothetical protein
MSYDSSTRIQNFRPTSGSPHASSLNDVWPGGVDLLLETNRLLKLRARSAEAAPQKINHSDSS